MLESVVATGSDTEQEGLRKLILLALETRRQIAHLLAQLAGEEITQHECQAEINRLESDFDSAKAKLRKQVGDKHSSCWDFTSNDVCELYSK